MLLKRLQFWAISKEIATGKKRDMDNYKYWKKQYANNQHSWKLIMEKPSFHLYVNMLHLSHKNGFRRLKEVTVCLCLSFVMRKGKAASSD